MDKTEQQANEGLVIEEISVDSQNLNLQSIRKQIEEIAKDKRVMAEKSNAFDILNALEGKSIETKKQSENSREDRE